LPTVVGPSRDQSNPILTSRKTIPLVILLASLATCSYAQISWSNESPAGISDDVWSVAYANSTFAAVTNQGRLLTSTDGLTWNSQVIDAGVWLVSIAYGNGTWVVVGDGGSILVSTDLKTWVIARAVTSNRLNTVFYTGTPQVAGAPDASPIFIAVGEGGTIVTSPDALNWTIQSSGVTGFLHGITIINGSNSTGTNGQLILVSGQGGVILQGAGNGTGFSSFPSAEVPTSQNLEAILCPFPNGDNPIDIVAVGDDGAIIDDVRDSAGFGDLVLSPWGNSASANPQVNYDALTYGNGYYVAAGAQGTILTSPDGTNWTLRFSGDSPSTVSTATLLGAAYSSTLQRFVVVGAGGTILVSNSPPTVFGNVSTRGFVSPTETFIGGFVVQGTAPRTVLIRGDGPVLSTFSVPSPLPDPVVTVYDNTGAIVATNTGWGTNANPTAISTAALEVGAFALPSSGADSALLLTLQPGAYTVQITSAKGNSGIALFEAYTN
jgi:hypothetical protein